MTTEYTGCFDSCCYDGILPFPQHNTKWPRHPHLTTVHPQVGNTIFSQCAVSRSWWSIPCTGFRVCSTWFAISFSLHSSDPKVYHTDLHFSSATTLHSNDTFHSSLSSTSPQTVSKDHTHLPPSLIQKTPYQGFWRSEVHVLSLRFRFVRQDLACVHTLENLPVHEEVNGIQSVLFQGYPRRVSSTPFFLKSCLKTTRIYPPVTYRKHSEVHLLRRIRFVRQDLVCVHSDAFGSFLLTGVCIFNDSLRGKEPGPSYIPFCLYHLPERHMMCTHF